MTAATGCVEDRRRVEIILKNRPEEQRRLRRALEEFAQVHGLPDAAVQAADLALEEHVSNVIAYAYSDKATHEIVVRLTIADGGLRIEVEDDGQPFDPLSLPAPDISLPLEERPVGGLGVHLIRKFMEAVDYRRDAGKNILRMRKRLN